MQLFKIKILIELTSTPNHNKLRRGWGLIFIPLNTV